MIVWKTKLDTIPQNCRECPLVHCTMPESRRGDKILKAYMNKRHPACPLIEIKEAQNDEPRKV